MALAEAQLHTPAKLPGPWVRAEELLVRPAGGGDGAFCLARGRVHEFWGGGRVWGAAAGDYAFDGDGGAGGAAGGGRREDRVCGTGVLADVSGGVCGVGGGGGESLGRCDGACFWIR